jgi:hypothetical protein
MIIFHRVLIGTAIFFCGGFAVWLGTRDGGGSGSLLLAAAFGLAALGLTYYLRHLNRFLHR